MQRPSAQLPLGDEDINAVLASGTVTKNHAVTAFEKDSPAYCGVFHIVTVSSGIAVFHAARIGPGNAVVAPVYQTQNCETASGVV